MVKIPFIKIPGVRVRSIGPTSNIGTGGATPAPPTPITYLTQWKIVGNSEVHTDPYLTSWKVLGNSVVDNNTILSCGDLGQDGKYHVKISNGVTIYDIPLTEPLRKLNDIADTVEFPSGTEGKALVTRNISATGIDNEIKAVLNGNSQYRWLLKGDAKISQNNSSANVLSNKYSTITANQTWLGGLSGVAIDNSGKLLLFDSDYVESADKETLIATNTNTIILYELATSTTELVDVPQIAVSPTDTYTSANVTPYSAFEHTENKEIWSCGEYSAVDGKYHILVQPQGGSIADIALTEPLRKVNSVADSIEFPSDTEGKALVTRNLRSVDLGDYTWVHRTDISQGIFTITLTDRKKEVNPSMMCEVYTRWTSRTSVGNASEAATLDNYNYVPYYLESSLAGFTIYFRNTDYADTYDFAQAVSGLHLLYQLATPTTELVDAPQIEEAESYSMVISQGGKAVEWSSFETNSE